MHLDFYGAAGTVTGSKFLLSNGKQRVLVDCGLFQGVKQNRLRNWEDPPFDPTTLNAIVLTHAHLDHSGYLPVLVKNGYNGPVYCTTGTRELSEIILRDSGYLQEEDAKFRNKYKTTKHDPALPLYTRKDAEQSLKLFKPVSFETEAELGGGLSIKLTRAGHILGSACVQVISNGRTIAFSGDLGRPDGPIMRAPEPIDRADYLVVESTYGNRLHQDENPEDQLADVINRTVDREGILLIPSFAVGRSTTILHFISSLMEEGRIPDVSVFLNSPMSINATEVYCEHHREHRLTADECRDIFQNVDFVRSVDASKALNTNKGPAIIVSASGMCEGGRILHHLKTMLPDPRNTVLFAGFQAPGTRGDKIQSGAETVKIHGEQIPCRAEVVDLPNLSAHADWREVIDWMRQIKEPPRMTFITHGEPNAAQAFQSHVREELGWQSEIPAYKEKVKLA
ncbi:MAG: MBL fold metallo-hydrolase [Candidatus Krumholzibacteria bacterium]|nr:MBL fold metallo-hydrolase [Candidatus Krumholzibacteria bacterium]